MTRIRGFLEGLQGPLNGRLYVRAAQAFIGAPEGDMAFRISNGEVDIELPPTPRYAPYFVDWRDIGDSRKLSFPERWLVPNVDEVALDELRGYKKQVQRRQGGDKGNAVENAVLKAENEDLLQKFIRLEKNYQQSLQRISIIEAQHAASTGKAASLEVSLLQEKAKNHCGPVRIVEKETFLERKVPIGLEEWQEKLAEETQRRTLIEQELEAMKAQFSDHLSLANHFGALHDEIDRLKLEKQQLLARIEDLKQPKRLVSSYRTEAIAELDKMMEA